MGEGCLWPLGSSPSPGVPPDGCSGFPCLEEGQSIGKGGRPSRLVGTLTFTFLRPQTFLRCMISDLKSTETNLHLWVPTIQLKQRKPMQLKIAVYPPSLVTSFIPPQVSKTINLMFILHTCIFFNPRAFPSHLISIISLEPPSSPMERQTESDY